MRIFACIVSLFFAATCLLPAVRADDDIDDIVRKLDELYRSNSSRSEAVMQIVTPHWERKLEMTVWTSGLDKTFIRIHSPRKEAGVATLRLDNEMWNYLPKVNKVIKVPPSMMTSSWMGSDFTNDDLVDEITWASDYEHEFADVATPREGLIYLQSTPHEGVPVVWGHVVSTVRSDDYLPVRQEYYDEKGNLMRTMVFSEIKMFGTRELPGRLELIPHNKEGHKTALIYESLEFDLDIGDDVFSLRHLRSPR